MSLSKIYGAFIAKINTVTPLIDTVYENKDYLPITGKEYQEVYILPSSNEVLYINETSYQLKGLIQITLCYPLNEGRSKAMNRADLYMDLFPPSTTLTIDGLEIKTIQVPQITNLWVDENRYKIALRVGFKCVL